MPLKLSLLGAYHFFTQDSLSIYRNINPCQFDFKSIFRAAADSRFLCKTAIAIRRQYPFTIQTLCAKFMKNKKQTGTPVKTDIHLSAYT